jgi:hypothetical protein
MSGKNNGKDTNTSVRSKKRFQTDCAHLLGMSSSDWKNLHFAFNANLLDDGSPAKPVVDNAIRHCT